MEIMDIIILVVALFFAGSWTFGLLSTPNTAPSTKVIVLYWWIEILIAFLDGYSALHLLWLMPLSMAVSLISVSQYTNIWYTASVFGVLVKSLVVLGPVIYFLITMA